MPEPDPDGAPPDMQAPDMQAVARDWITVWRSELNALAVDREAAEGWTRAVGLWAAAAAPGAPGEPPGRPGTAAPAGAAATGAAPDGGGAGGGMEQLARRVAELEQRLAALER